MGLGSSAPTDELNTGYGGHIHGILAATVSVIGVGGRHQQNEKSNRQLSDIGFGGRHQQSENSIRCVHAESGAKCQGQARRSECI